MSLTSILQTISKEYTPLSDKTIAHWASLIKQRTYPKGYILVKEGQYSDMLYYIVKGAIKAYYLKDGKNVTDWFAFEGDFMCAITSYFLQVPSPHYIETLEEVHLLSITREEMNLLCDNYHDFERLGRISCTKTMLQLQQRIVSLQFETAQQRYENLLERFPVITQRASLRDIASFLGITQETLSRIRANTRI
ncbi:Crp/Fnr family transcriptional regulator [Aquimarina hainanensis]|uniref:Crp/Fnr family transcriptional regulator n=1 Tax=Aquimarina hainanensis TaxID=1578017 RepID=A0ABW5NAJ4_9FLAO|nr:Crp/Fnr family transcriptional regulator [Aquimarina sp. TRL1]QKX05710.1 Crp/Fnr family transcriptional regulator [Aquimarina sp. TRL1]